jgi:KUP system potassium uptake protein
MLLFGVMTLAGSPAMIGGAALLADGMITPPISVTSAISLRQLPA